MSQVRGERIQEVKELAGVWQFGRASTDYVGIVRREPQAELSLFAFSSGHWTLRHRIPLDGPLRTSDAQIVGGDLFFCWERNHDEALWYGKWSVADLTAAKPVPLALLGSMGLSEEQGARVAPSPEWSVISTLPPSRWIFNPRWVHGDPNLVVANTVDGQAMLFAPGSGARKRRLLEELYGTPQPSAHKPPSKTDSFGVANAIGPQAQVVRGRRYVAFKHVAGEVHPFELRSHYGGRTTQTPGSLSVIEGTGAPRDLSSQLEIGPITSFSLTQGAGETPWIFAVRLATAGSEVVAIAQEKSGWSIRGIRPIDNLVQELIVWLAKDGWQIVYAAKDSESWSVWHLPWKGMGS